MSKSKNHKLKHHLEIKFDSIVNAAHCLEINNSRLSQIINGWASATGKEINKLETALGKSALKLGLTNKKNSGHKEK